MNFLLLLALLHPHSILGVHLGDQLDSFSDKHINAFCGRDATTVVCEQDDAIYAGRRAYMRAEFLENQLIYLSYTLDAGAATAQKISASLVKQYGMPPGDTEMLPDRLDQTWGTERSENGQGVEELELTYTSAAENGLGHPIIRISLAEK